MPFLTEAERAQIIQFDPGNLPHWARMLTQPADLARLRNPASGTDVLLQTVDWGKLGLRPIIDTHKTLAATTRVLILAQYRRDLQRLQIRKSAAELNRDFEAAVRILNNKRAKPFLHYCQNIPYAFMRNLDWLTSANAGISFETASGQSMIHQDGKYIRAAFSTEFGGPFFPDLDMMKACGLEGRHPVQAALAHGVKVYQAPIGMIPYFDAMRPHGRNPTEEDSQNARPIIQIDLAYRPGYIPTYPDAAPCLF